MTVSIHTKIREYLEKKISSKRILVIGDIMLDRYFLGEVNRISPEAPVPVTLIKKKKDVLGGAANVAHNIVSLGGQVTLIGAVAKDHHGKLLIKEMDRLGIKHDGVLPCRKDTTTKVRVLGGHQQMLRMDFEENSKLDYEAEMKLITAIKQVVIDGVDAVIVSDYKKGVCSANLCQQVIDIAHDKDIKVFIDPKGNVWDKYRGADFITPNVKEISDVMGNRIENSEDELRIAAKDIREKYSIANIISTRSEKGMSLFTNADEIHIPTVAQEVFDVSGAGDTVLSAFALGIAGGLDFGESAVMANIAAGISVGKVGTYAVSKNEVLKELI